MILINCKYLFQRCTFESDDGRGRDIRTLSRVLFTIKVIPSNGNDFQVNFVEFSFATQVVIRR